MPTPTYTRAVKLRLVVPRGANDDGSTQALWTTHREVNNAVRSYQEMLIAMRQEQYEPRDGVVVAKAEVLKQAKLLLKGAWDANEVPDEERREEQALEALERLYHVIVKGTAQEANALISPFFDPDSSAFAGHLEIIRSLPNWLGGEIDDIRDAAQQWLDDGHHHQLKPSVGSPPKWYKKALDSDWDWPSDLHAWGEGKKDEVAKGPAGLVLKLRELRVLPLRPSYFAPLLHSTSKVTPWDRLCFRLAVAQLESWQTWTEKSAEEYERRTEDLRKKESNFKEKAAQEVFEALQAYEAERAKESMALNPHLGAEEHKTRITSRTLRGWADLKEAWSKDKDQTLESLKAIIAKQQTKKRGRFGDPHLFGWLADPKRHWVWKGRGDDFISAHAIINQARIVVEESREQATLTFADALGSPRACQWEYSGGANLKNWRLHKSDKGNLAAEFDLLATTSDGLEEVSHCFSIAGTDQLKVLEIKELKAKKYGIEYITAAGLAQAALGSADLLLNWRWLRNKRLEDVDHGKIGAAYLKVAIAIDEQAEESVLAVPKGVEWHFLTAKAERSKHQDKVKEGTRVLSVDLGVRHLASCSVFELKSHKPVSSSMSFKVPDMDLWAIHERSFSIKLQDEKTDKRRKAWQDDQTAELRRLRSALTRYRNLRDLLGEEEADRAEAHQALIEPAHVNGFPFELPIIGSLKAHLSQPRPVWEGEITKAVQSWRAGFSPILSEWRRTNRSKDTRKHYGKSMWAIEHLTETRRLLQSWSLLAGKSGQINRWDREYQGVFAQHLLDHLDGIKDDRMKSGADMLVQAARGYLRNDEGRWEQRYEPCHVVLFEDLSRYRTRQDRPKRENSQLMKWAHRGFRLETDMQAQVYRIATADLDASYTSRFRAKDGSPGHRLTPLTKAILSDATRMEWITRDNEGIDVSKLQPGMLVLDPGGPLLGTLENGGLVTLQADINAAHSLQKRFWTRFGHAQILRSCQKTKMPDGSVVWVPRSMAKRIKGTMDGFGVLIETGHESGSARWETKTLREYKKLGGSEGANAAPSDDTDAELEELAEALELIKKEQEISNFFMDESGNILPDGLWYPSKTFWGIVKSKIYAKLKVQWS